MLKYLQRVPLDISLINWLSLHQDERKTRKTRIAHNATCYHKFKALPHVVSYIFPQFHMDRRYWNGLS